MHYVDSQGGRLASNKGKQIVQHGNPLIAKSDHRLLITEILQILTHTAPKAQCENKMSATSLSIFSVQHCSLVCFTGSVRL